MLKYIVINQDGQERKYVFSRLKYELSPSVNLSIMFDVLINGLKVWNYECSLSGDEANSFIFDMDTLKIFELLISNLNTTGNHFELSEIFEGDF